MPANIQTIKDEAPAIYWAAVDMVQDGKSASYIMQQIAWRIEAHNEKAAIQGRPTIAVSV